MCVGGGLEGGGGMCEEGRGKGGGGDNMDFAAHPATHPPPFTLPLLPCATDPGLKLYFVLHVPEVVLYTTCP